MAGVPGLEPRLNEPESLGLPITPYPIWHCTRERLTILAQWRVAREIANEALLQGEPVSARGQEFQVIQTAAVTLDDQ